jgi:hypothetical protein
MHLRIPSFRQSEALVAVLETGSLTRAHAVTVLVSFSTNVHDPSGADTLREQIL